MKITILAVIILWAMTNPLALRAVDTCKVWEAMQNTAYPNLRGPKTWYAAPVTIPGWTSTDDPVGRGWDNDPWDFYTALDTIRQITRCITLGTPLDWVRAGDEVVFFGGTYHADSFGLKRPFIVNLRGTQLKPVLVRSEVCSRVIWYATGLNLHYRRQGCVQV